MDINIIKERVEEVLKQELGDKYRHTCDFYREFGGGISLKIVFSCHNADGQRAQTVSLSLNSKLELQPQIFGGIGGRTISRMPNRELSAEKHLYCKSIVIPFRTPKKEIDKVLICLKTFINNYKNILKENRSRLMYQDLIDYDSFL